MSNLDKAREWAESLTAGPATDRAQAAAKVIQSLPNAWVDVEKVRELLHWREVIEQTPIRPTEAHLIALLHALITPKLPTLAELIKQGNDPEQYRWMQAKVFHTEELGCVTNFDLFGECATALFPNGVAKSVPYEDITPLTGEPKLEFPGGVVDCEIVEESAHFDNLPGEAKQVMKESIEEYKAGKFVDFDSSPRSETTNSDPIHTPMQPSEVPPNEPWLIEVDGQKAIGTRHKGNTIVPWSVAALDGSFAGDFHDNEITLIHKLVPEPPALPEGMRLADHEEYGRVVVSPEDDLDGDYRVFCPQDNTEYGANWWYAHKSELTFLGGANNG